MLQYAFRELDLDVYLQVVPIISFSDQLKCLSDNVASLEATVASVPVTAREIEDKSNVKLIPNRRQTLRRYHWRSFR